MKILQLCQIAEVPHLFLPWVQASNQEKVLINIHAILALEKEGKAEGKKITKQGHALILIYLTSLLKDSNLHEMREYPEQVLSNCAYDEFWTQKNEYPHVSAKHMQKPLGQNNLNFIL